MDSKTGFASNGEIYSPRR